MADPVLRSNAFLAVACSTALQVVIGMANLILPTVAPKVAETLGVNPALIGYQVSLTSAVAMISSFFAGNAVLRWGAGRSTQICAVLCASGFALFTVPSVAAIAAGSVMVGVAWSLNGPAAAELIVNYTGLGRRNLMFSIKQTGVPIGGLVIALVAPTMAVTVGWRWTLPLIVAISLAMILVIESRRATWDASRRTRAHPTQYPFGGIPLVWERPTLRWIAWVGFCFGSIQRLLLTFTVVYLVAEADYTLIEAGVALAVVQAAGFGGRLFWGWFADRTRAGISVLIVIGLLTMAAYVPLMLMSAAWPKAAVYPVFALLGMAALGWNGVLHAEMARICPPGAIAVVASGTAFFIHAGIMITPALFVAVYGMIGSYSGTFGLIVLAGSASLILLLLARRAIVNHAS